MLAADSVITDLSTWDAAAWLAAVAALIALGALVTAVFARLDSRRSSRAGEDSAKAAKRSATASERSAMTGEAAERSARRSADAAERALALQERAAQVEAVDRHEAAGPRLTPVEDAVLNEERMRVEFTLRMDGGPAELLLLQLTVDDAWWCTGLSDPGGSHPGTMVATCEQGGIVTAEAHVVALPWTAADYEILPVTVNVQSEDGARRWDRRVSVRVVPHPPAPLAVPPDPDSDRPNLRDVGF